MMILIYEHLDELMQNTSKSPEQSRILQLRRVQLEVPSNLMAQALGPDPRDYFTSNTPESSAIQQAM